LPNPATDGYVGTGIKGRAKVTDEIIRTLMHDIASRLLPPGSRLPNESRLAEHFGVSQPTIREVMRVLDTLGLVEVRHGSGAYVTADTSQLVSISLETLLQIEQVSILDVSEIRGVLGRLSARRAAEHASADEVGELDKLASALEDTKSVNKPQQIVENVAAFQVALSAASHNPLLYALETFLIRLLMQFQYEAKRKRGIQFWRGWVAEFSDNRAHVVEALRERDADAAVSAMDTYVNATRNRFASDPDLAHIRLSDPSSLRTLAESELEIPIHGNNRKAG
jgi:GntR family transcriptional regulator, transcriptional repressor for pyruvate dehydrogenase complex